jgi:hypothetical protein
VADGLSVSTKSIVLAEPYTEETIHHIEPKYIKDMYYEETSEGEKTVTTPNDPFAQWPYPQENGISYGDDYFMRITDDAPAQADIIEMMISGEPTVAGSDLQSFDITGSVDFPSTVQGYSANPFVSSRQMFIVVSEDTVVDGNTYKKGIYVPHIQLFANPYVSEITYNGETTTVHQIPAKYIPSTGLEYYEIEATTLNPQQLNSVELTGYNYQDIVDALEAGKILVLTLRYDYGGENPVYGKYIGGQPSRMYNPDNDYGMACVRFPAAYSYLNQTISGHFNAAVVKDIVIYEDWSQGGDEPILMLGVEDVTIV